MRSNPTQILTKKANGAIAGHRICRLDATDTTGETAALAVDEATPLFGVSDALGAADGGSLDVICGGVYGIEYGADVAVNDPLTSDAQGRAIPVPASVATVHIIGWAAEAGAEGEICSVSLVPARLAQ